MQRQASLSQGCRAGGQRHRRVVLGDVIVAIVASLKKACGSGGCSDVMDAVGARAEKEERIVRYCDSCFFRTNHHGWDHGWDSITMLRYCDLGGIDKTTMFGTRPPCSGDVQDLVGTCVNEVALSPTDCY